MTVQPDSTTVPRTVALPEQRAGEHDAADARPPAVPAARELPRGWGSQQDRTMARRMLAMMVLLGCYAALMVFVGDRVFA